MESEPAARVVADALGWSIDSIVIEDKSGHGGSKTYKVSAPGKESVAMHCRSTDSDAISGQRLAAATAHFAKNALAPSRLVEGDGWFIERWEGTPVGTHTYLNDGHSKVVLVAKDDPAQLVFEHAATLRAAFPDAGCREQEPEWKISQPIVGPFASTSTAVPLTLTSHQAFGVGVRQTVAFGPFQLRCPILVCADAAVSASFDGAFLTSDAFVLDVAHANYHVNNDLNWLTEGGDVEAAAGDASAADVTRRIGGERDWIINASGTISPRRAPTLVLGVLAEEGGAQATATVEELGALLGRVHSTSTDWFDPWRTKLIHRYPGLEVASKGSTVWWHTSQAGILESLSPQALRKWLRACPTPRTPAGARVVTAHADFHPANILRTTTGLCTIDHEYTCVTSACNDIAWALLLWLKGAAPSRAFVKSYLEAMNMGQPARAEEVDGLLLDAHTWRFGLVFGGEGGLWEEVQALINHPDGEIGGLTKALVALMDEARGDAVLREEILEKGGVVDTKRGRAVKRALGASVK